MSEANIVEMYATGICPYCIAAKGVLERKGVRNVKVIRVDQEPTLREQMVERSGGRRTVPQIFIAGVHVGGHDDLVALDRKGGLDPLLAQLS
jgi:glutaredoxin 3